ncbi:MAG: porin [Gammaproteobacteria bacterium]|nr:porin [Gammaproteobacteria bacterium]MBU0829782.1 porin [Gammaproteobacteria bacterium]MBU0893470.1 porin [Gammaproteobacteria bacterium]MBU1353754.1 porin [Gammaproteobacteria bacterium]MBU1507955.1 porin [Gammaproteobacteria bacterium]
MKKFATLAVLAAVSATSYAQSSVTLFGVADVAFQIGRGSEANRTSQGSGGLSSSRLGFRGIEDLGGGLKAGFWLEAGYNLDDGTGVANTFNFNRRSTVSLMGDNWGEVRLGRDFTATYNNIYDAFGDNGVGALLKTTSLGSNYGYAMQTRTSNAVSYFTPKNLGGFVGQAQYYRGEAANGANDGTGYGLRGGYENGPLNVGVSYGAISNLGVYGDVTNANIGGSYDFGVAKLLVVAGQDESKARDEKARHYMIGATAPVGSVGLVRASWSRISIQDTNVQANKFAVGYVHNLSKRTALYTTFAYLKNKNGAALALNGAKTSAGDNSKGLDIGLRHTF